MNDGMILDKKYEFEAGDIVALKHESGMPTPRMTVSCVTAGIPTCMWMNSNRDLCEKMIPAAALVKVNMPVQKVTT